MTRIISTIAVVVLAFGALMTFPAHTLWMASIWLALSLIAHARGKPMWPWLVSCVAILLLKQTGNTFGFWTLVLAMVGVALANWRVKREHDTPINWTRFALFSLVLISAATIFQVTRWNATNTNRRPVYDSRPIACLGDSLTDFGYPEELAKLIKVPIADFGVNGITTDDGIKMIPEILAADPQLIVIELGGHDYNGDHKTRAETKSNLVRLVSAFRESDIEVILIEIPRGFITDPYRGLEREISAQFDLQLIDDTVIRSFIFNSPIMPPGIWLKPSKHYSADGLHPNELGNKHFARVVCQSIAKLYGESVLRKPER